MNETIRSGNSQIKQFIVKGLIFGVQIFVGVTGGVYVGTALSNRPAPFELTPDILPNNSRLNIGDTFPDYKLKKLIDNSETTTSAFAGNASALLLFVSTSCEACNTLVEIFNKEVAGQIDKGIQIAMIYDFNEEVVLRDSYDEQLISGAEIFCADRHKQSQTDGIAATPTLVGVSKQGEIQFIMSGYNRKLDADFINSYL